MDIMHACDFYNYPMAKKRKEKEKQASKRLVYPNILSHTSPQNLHHTYLHRKNAIQSIVYVPYSAFKIIFLFIVQFEDHGIVAV
jgi:hypothetical protein